MKTLSHIFILLLLTLGSCTSSLYTGAEYDDLYFSASDKPIVKAKPSVNERIAEGTLKSDNYYDNIYAADTLVSEQYSDAVDYDNAIVDNNNYDGQYNYYNDYSYSGRLRRFHGNYFDPYWRDSFYFDYGYPSFGYNFSFGGFPYNYYNQFNLDPYYSYGGYYGDYYGGYYGGFGSYFSPFYGNNGYYAGSYFINDGKNSVTYGRNERPSTLSTRWNSNINASASGRRDSYLSSGGNSGVGRRMPSGISGTQAIGVGSRRTGSNNVVSQQALNSIDRKLGQDQVKGENIRSITSAPRSSANTRSEYNSANRTYTPSYSNPRLSTRPSYNNSKVSDGINSNNIRNSGTINSSRINSSSGSRFNAGQGSY
ncbi:MAG: hypothetical protein WCS03_14650, partial [Bacteroidota bacterium]